MNRNPCSDPIDEFAAVAAFNGYRSAAGMERVMRALPVLDRTPTGIDFPRERWASDRWLSRRDVVAAVADLKGGEICARCGGHGGFSGWPGWACFDCGGRGWNA